METFDNNWHICQNCPDIPQVFPRMSLMANPLLLLAGMPSALPEDIARVFRLTENASARL